MAQNGAKKAKMIERRKAVWNLRLQGKTQASIAEELGVCQRTVVRDLNYLDSPYTGRGAYSRQSMTPYRFLGLSVVLRAILDCRAGDSKARLWLLDDALVWLEGCEVDFDLGKWQVWVNAGCPYRQPRKAFYSRLL